MQAAEALGNQFRFGLYVNAIATADFAASLSTLLAADADLALFCHMFLLAISHLPPCQRDKEASAVV